MTAQQSPLDRPEILASDAERRQTSALLKEACVEGRLTLEEFGERVGKALAARTRGELQEITRDLPPAPVRTAAAQRAVSSTVAVMSEAERSGHWRIGEESRALAVMGSCKLDLRGAAISAPVTTITARVIMGSLDVFVPEGVEVDLDVMAIAGSKTLRLSGPPPAPGAPVIRITGVIVAGAVNVRDQVKLSDRLREGLAGLFDAPHQDERAR
jgi:hypothetical protein